MNEREFLYLLQERAREQKRAMDAVPFPKIFGSNGLFPRYTNT